MRYPLPYAFARSNALLLEDDGHALTLWHDARPEPGAFGEVMRKYAGNGAALVLQRADPGTLAQRISAAYARGESSAATVVSEVESDADLSRIMQELPAIADLLENSDDAPIIRMLNALLTQAAKRGSAGVEPIAQCIGHQPPRFALDRGDLDLGKRRGDRARTPAGIERM